LIREKPQAPGSDEVVTDRPRQSARHRRLQGLDRRLEQDPDAIDARFERAGLLREQGSFAEAKRDYLALLERMPTHFGGLNDFGTLLVTAGFRDAARTVFSQAVHHHPSNPAGHVNLANFLFLAGEPLQARIHFDAALKLDPGHVHAHRGLANVLAEIGDEAGARRHRDCGFKNNFLTTLPYHGDGPPVSVLLLVSALGGNIPTTSLLDDKVFRTIVLVTEYDDPAVPLPPHDLVFNGIGDADLCRQGLDSACSVLARTPRPVINHPSAILKTGRMSNAERLDGVPGVVVPRMANMSRDQLAGAQARTALDSKGLGFPLLLRAPGFHTGRHFIRVDGPDDLSGAVNQLPADDLWVIEHLDARTDDGRFRKCRVMIVDGRLYPLHLATSSNWKVHYFTAEMADSTAKRAHDAVFLENMSAVVGARGLGSLEQIRRVLDLDYGGIDFAVNPDGEILFSRQTPPWWSIRLRPRRNGLIAARWSNEYYRRSVRCCCKGQG
jgi:Flp pilus assembly protein TadD